MRKRRQHRRRRGPGQGYSQPGSRQYFNGLFHLMGVRKEEKREMFNSFASTTVISVGLAAFIAGLLSGGLVSGLVYGLVGLVGAGIWAERKRFFR